MWPYPIPTAQPYYHHSPYQRPWWWRRYPWQWPHFGADITSASSAAGLGTPAAPGAFSVGPASGLAGMPARGILHPAPPSAPMQGQGAAVYRQSLFRAFRQLRLAYSHRAAYADWRRGAIAQAAVAGIATPIGCRASFGATWTCPVYNVVTGVNGAPDLSAPIARVPGGATGLFADLDHPYTFSQGVGLGVVTVYRVAWIDAPNGPVYGYMPDGGFERNP